MYLSLASRVGPCFTCISILTTSIVLPNESVYNFFAQRGKTELALQVFNQTLL